MESEIKVIHKDLLKLMREVEQIKQMLISRGDDEGELTDWAKEELERARSEPEDSYTHLEDL